MHAVKSALLIAGLIFLGSACSSGTDDGVQNLEPTSNFEAKFKAYDLNGDGVVSEAELLQVEKKAKSVVIVDDASAKDMLETCDMSADRVLDKVEFTGMIEKGVLVGLPK